MKKPRGELLLSVTIRDCEVQHFAAGGKGGQHQNTSNTGTRVIHRPSGAAGEARDSRSQHQNTRNAFIRMTETTKFRTWLNRAIWTHGRNLEHEVRESMRPELLRIEGRNDEGRWVAIG